MSEIIVPTEIEQIRLRATQHIGSTENPNQLLREVIDNSEDECINGFGDTINITIENNIATVTDNGRGIPNDLVAVEMYNEEIIHLDSVIAAFTISHSGGKFNKNTYKISKGMHGFGLAAVNALSDYVKVITKDRHKKHVFNCYYFKNSKLLKHTSIEDKKIRYSTLIEFKPSDEYFTNEFNLDDEFIDNLKFVKSRLSDKINYILNDEKIPYIKFDKYITNILKIDSSTELYNFQTSIENDKVEVYFTYDTTNSYDPKEKIFGDVNLIGCKGTYISNFRRSLINQIYTKHETKLKKVNKDWLSLFLKAYIVYYCENPEFNAQVKVNMIQNASKIMNSFDFNSFTSSKFCRDVIEHIIEFKAIKSSKSTKSLKRISHKNPVLDAEIIPGDNMYIIEGASALIDRNTKTEGIYLTGGKINNVFTTSVSKLSTGVKFKNISEAIGINLKGDNNYRYNKFKIITDADKDGLHICCLCIILFWQYGMDKIESGDVSIIFPPLYGAKKDNKFVSIYKNKDINKYIQDGWTISRFKGLGEMEPKDLNYVIRDNPKEYIIKPPKTDVDIEHLSELITNTEMKKVFTKNYNYGFEKFLDQII